MNCNPTGSLKPHQKKKDIQELFQFMALMMRLINREKMRGNFSLQLTTTAFFSTPQFLHYEKLHHFSHYKKKALLV